MSGVGGSVGIALCFAMGCGWFDDVRLRPRVDTSDASDATVEGGLTDALPGDASDSSDTANRDSGPTYPPPTVDLRWHPEDRRMAITHDTPEGDSFRVWLLVHGTTSNPHCLVTKDGDRDGWVDTGICNVTTDVDAVTFAEASTQTSRVFFGLDGQLRAYSFESYSLPPSSQPPTEIPAEDGYTIDGGDLAAVTFSDASSRHIVVMAAAKKGSEPGHYCVYENVDLASDWTVHCSAAPVLSMETDVVGAEIGGVVHFYFKGADGGLHRVIAGSGITTPTDEAVVIDTATQPIQPSLFAIPSVGVMAGDFAVGFIDAEKRIWTGHLSAKGDPPLWGSLPSLPNGITPLTTQSSLNANAFLIDTAGIALYVLASDRQVYAMLGDAYGWTNRYASLELPGAQFAHAIGASGTKTVHFGSATYDNPSVFLSVGGDTASTLEEAFLDFTYYDFVDHVRPQPDPVQVFGPDVSESSVAAGPDLGLAAATRRGDGIPLRVTLASTIDGASSWADSGELTPLPSTDPSGARASASHPMVAYGGGMLHLVDLEQDLPSDCTLLEEYPLARIVYRRGSSAAEIAKLDETSPDVMVVASGRVSDPSFAVTEDTNGVTAHVLYWDHDEARMKYWMLPPSGSAPPPTGISTNFLPEGRSILRSSGSELYGGTLTVDGFPMFCNFSDGPPQSTGTCFPAGGAATLRAAAVDIPLATDAQPSACASVNGSTVKCIRDDEPLSLAVGSTNRLFVAYTAVDGTETSVYFSESQGGADIAAWSTPMRLNDRPTGDHTYYFDPEIAEIADGGIVVTFSAIMPSITSTPNRVQNYLARSADGVGAYWGVTPLTDWDPSNLEFDCTTQKWSLGDYRLSSTLGRGRTLHVLRSGSSAPDGDANVPAAPGCVSRWFTLAPVL